MSLQQSSDNNTTVNMNSNNVSKDDYNPPLGSPYTQMDCKFEADIIRQVIGREGCYFKQITQKTGVYYIWHQREKGFIEIWGPEENLQKAIKQIHNRLYFVISNMLRGSKQISNYSWSWYQWYSNIRFTPNIVTTEQQKEASSDTTTEQESITNN